jgi:hypothetical protein
MGSTVYLLEKEYNALSLSVLKIVDFFSVRYLTRAAYQETMLCFMTLLFLKSLIIKKAPPDFLKQKIQRSKVGLNEQKPPNFIDSFSCLFESK